MYKPSLARLKKQLVERRYVLREKYDNALPEREYLIQVGQVRELNATILLIDEALKQPEDKDE